MFSLNVIDTDAFMGMTQGSRLLYYELCMRADDDGFVASPRKIMRMVGCCERDLNTLIENKFVIPFNTGVICIKHWRIHNYIQNDRYKPTLYTNEKNELAIDDNGSYFMYDKNDTKSVQNGYNDKNNVDTKSLQNVSPDKNSIDLDIDIDKNSINTHSYICHLKKEEKILFVLVVKRKMCVRIKQVKDFLNYMENFEDYLKYGASNKLEDDSILFDYDWLNDESEDNK